MICPGGDGGEELSPSRVLKKSLRPAYQGIYSEIIC